MMPLVRVALAVAHRRWPADLRDERRREWEAELYELGADQVQWGAARVVGQLRFALSLAWSPPAADEHGVPRGWREMLPGVGRGLRPVLALAGAGMLSMVLASGLPVLGGGILAAVRGFESGLGPYWHTSRIDWPAHTVALTCMLIATVLAGMVGAWVGRAVPVEWAHHGRAARTGSAVIAPVLLAGATYGLRRLLDLPHSYDGATTVYLPSDRVWAGLAWALSVAVVGALTVRWVQRGRLLRAWAVGVTGGTVALLAAAVIAGLRTAVRVDLDVATAPLWLPLALLDLAGTGFTFGEHDQGWIASQEVIGNVAATVRPLLCATAFAISYGVSARTAQPRVDLPEPVSHAATASSTASSTGLSTGPRARPLPSWVSLVTCTTGVLLWAYTLAFATPQMHTLDNNGFFGGELHIWVQELREGAILLAVLGLVVAGAWRGLVLLPALLVGAVLMAVDSVVDARDIGGAQVLFASGTLALAVLSGGLWLGARLGRAAPAVAASRRAMIGAAVVAAWCAPAQLSHATGPDSANLVPIGLPAGSAVCGAFLTIFAVMVSARAAGRRPLGIAVAGPAVILAVLGALTPRIPELMVAASLGPVLVVLVVAGVRPDNSPRWRRVRRWGLRGFGALLCGFLLLYVQILLSLPFGSPLMTAAGYGFPADGVPFLPGALLCGVVVATVCAVRLVPAESASVEPETVTMGW